MTRNLESRVELLAPIDDLSLQAELRECLDLQLHDTVGAWEMQPDGNYRKLEAADGAIHAQVAMLESVRQPRTADEDKSSAA